MILFFFVNSKTLFFKIEKFSCEIQWNFNFNLRNFNFHIHFEKHFRKQLSKQFFKSESKKVTYEWNRGRSLEGFHADGQLTWPSRLEVPKLLSCSSSKFWMSKVRWQRLMRERPWSTPTAKDDHVHQLDNANATLTVFKTRRSHML